MNKKIAAVIILTAMLAISVFSACASQKEAAETHAALHYTDFIGKRVGAALGSVSERLIMDVLDGTPVQYSEHTAGFEDVRRGRIDGHMADLSTLRVIAAAPGNEVFTVVEVPAEVFSAPMGAFSANQDIIDRFNAFLAAAEADGTLGDMQARWLHTVPDLDSPMPAIPTGGGGGVLRVATTGLNVPFTYVGADNELKGYSVELAIRFAAHEGMEIAFDTMEFGSLIPHIVSGKGDLGIANVSITEERKQSVHFTNSVYDDQLGILALRQNSAGITDYNSIAGSTLGMRTGTMFDYMVEDMGATPAFYFDASAAIEDTRKGRIDGFIADLSSLRILVAMPGNEDLDVVALPNEIFEAPMAAISLNQDIIDRFNIFLAGIIADGTLDDMQDRWLNTAPDSESPMPEIPLTGANGTLKAATSAGSMPFAYMGAGGELKGYSIELARRFAAHEGMDIEFADMDFSGMIPYIIAGRADFAIADISITEERSKSVTFTDPIYVDGAGVVVLKSQSGTAGEDIGKDRGGFISWLKTGIENNLIKDNRWKLILDGLGATMIISLAAQLFGTVLGCFICFMLMRKNRAVKWLGSLYCGLIHGTPIVVLLMITYYIIFGSTQISGIMVAIAAFTLITGAGVAGNLKGAIETVDAVEIEAARSIGFSAFKAFTAVTLPQAVRRALPGYTRGFVELVKATAIVGYIAIQDLTRAGDIIRSRTYDAYFPLLLVAVIYLIVTTVCIQLFSLAVKRFSGETERARRPRRMETASEIDRRSLQMKGGA